MEARPFGDELAQAVRKYLHDNVITQSKLTGEILADIGQRFYDHYQAKQTAKKKRGDATPEEIAIYESYPRKVGREDALRAIRAALEQSSGQTLLDAARRYAHCVARWPRNFRYTSEGKDVVPYPATWFRAGRYSDAPSEWMPAGMFTREDDPQLGSSSEDRLAKHQRPTLLEPEGWKEEFPNSTFKDWKEVPTDSKKAICDHMNKVRS